MRPVVEGYCPLPVIMFNYFREGMCREGIDGTFQGRVDLLPSPVVEFSPMESTFVGVGIGRDG